MNESNPVNNDAALDSFSEEAELTIRRAPKIPAFLIVGGGLGAIVTFVLTALFPVDPLVGFAALFGYFALFGVTGGVLLGALVALILDRIATRRARTARVMRETIETPTNHPTTP
jgi:hypothetical protein